MADTNKGLEVGQVAPAWTLVNDQGRRMTLAQFKGRPLVMFFFRGTWCPTCRKQMADISQRWANLSPLAQVVGIVAQSEAETRNYLSRNSLPFPLLPDPDREVIKAYGVYQRFGLNGFRTAHPTTLIIRPDGIIHLCYVGDSQFDRPDLNNIIQELGGLQKLTA